MIRHRFSHSFHSRSHSTTVGTVGPTVMLQCVIGVLIERFASSTNTEPAGGSKSAPSTVPTVEHLTHPTIPGQVLGSNVGTDRHRTTAAGVSRKTPETRS